MCVCVYVCWLLSHVRLCDPMDCRLWGSSVRGISQAKILEEVATKNIICRIKQSLTFLSPPLSPTPFSHTSLILLRLFSCLDISLLRDILYHSWVLHGEPQLWLGMWLGRYLCSWQEAGFIFLHYFFNKYIVKFLYIPNMCD